MYRQKQSIKCIAGAVHRSTVYCELKRNGGKRGGYDQAPAQARANLCRSISDRGRIEERLKEADGTRFGDWEMDTVIGKDGKDAILTLTERLTNFYMAAKLPKGKDAEGPGKDSCQVAHIAYIGSIRTITTDNGTEFACHGYIVGELHTTVYFAHPHSTWEKGTIENFNKLLR